MLARLLAFRAAARALVAPLALALAALQLVHALERGERPEAVLYLREPRADDRGDHLLRRLVAGRGLVQGHAAVGVDDDSGLAVLVVHLALRERAVGLAARDAPARAVVDREAAALRARERTQDVAPVLVAARYEHGVPPLLPDRALQERVARGEGARRALAVNPHVAELRVPLLLHEVVADLVDQLKLLSEDLAEGLRHLLEDDEPVQDGVVAPGRHRVQVVAVVPRLGREVAEVYVFEKLRVL